MKTLRFLSAFVGAAVFGLVIAGCGRIKSAGKPADVDYYTCTMHPSVKSQDPKAK